MKGIFTSYDTDKRDIPVAVCPKHWFALMRHSTEAPSWLENDIKTLNSRFEKTQGIRAPESSGSSHASY